MRQYLCIAIFVGLTAPWTLAEDKSVQIPQEELESFYQNAEIAGWIAQYDRVAWVSTEKLMKAPVERRAGLGPAWFCYETKDGWHAVYGRLAADGKTYDVAFHYLVNADEEVSEVANASSDPQHLALARAMTQAHSKVLIPTYQEYGVKLNPYVRRKGETVEVWFVPAWQPNGVIALGRTHRLTFSQDGTEVQAHDRWDYGLRGIRPDKEGEIVIGDEKFSHPTVGDIFFVLYYGRMFKMVMINSKTFTSTLITVEDDSVWFHVVKPEKTEAEADSNKTLHPDQEPPSGDSGG